eukprot:scaffold20542_cov49-Attheya_sp.AAC.1
MGKGRAPPEKDEDGLYPFWTPPLEDRPSDQPFHLVEIPSGPEPRKSLFLSNPDLLFEYMTGAAVLAVGIPLVIIGWDQSNDDISTKKFFSGIFLAAGLIPLVGAFLELLRSRTNRGLKIEDVAPIIFVALSTVLDPTGNGSWMLVLGSIFFESSLIYWILRVFFIIPPESEQIRKLERQVEDLKRSRALGVAEGYFLNFVRWKAMDLSRFQNKETGTSNTPLVIRNPAKVEENAEAKVEENAEDPNVPHYISMVMEVPYLIIAVPRKIDWWQDEPFKNMIAHYRKTKQMIDCCIGVLTTNDFRPQWIAATKKKVPGGTLPGGTMPGTMFDIPTALQPLRVVWLAKKYKMSEYVRVVEFEDDVLKLMSTVNEACMKPTGFNIQSAVPARKREKKGSGDASVEGSV